MNFLLSVSLRKEMVDHLRQRKILLTLVGFKIQSTEHYIFHVHTNKPLAASAFLIASSSAFSLALAASTSLSRAAMGLRYSE